MFSFVGIFIIAVITSDPDWSLDSVPTPEQLPFGYCPPSVTVG